jgi:hypothetical protein
MSNNVLGTGLVREVAPTFANFVVVDGTWKEKDTTMHERTDGGDGNVLNYSFWKPGVDATCDLVLKVGSVPLLIGDVLTETADPQAGATVRSFVVLDATKSNFGGKPLRQAVQLAYHTGFTPTVVS